MELSKEMMLHCKAESIVKIFTDYAFEETSKIKVSECTRVFDDLNVTQIEFLFIVEYVYSHLKFYIKQLQERRNIQSVNSEKIIYLKKISDEIFKYLTELNKI
jgi:hypothetical protein